MPLKCFGNYLKYPGFPSAPPKIERKSILFQRVDQCFQMMDISFVLSSQRRAQGEIIQQKMTDSPLPKNTLLSDGYWFVEIAGPF